MKFVTDIAALLMLIQGSARVAIALSSRSSRSSPIAAAAALRMVTSTTEALSGSTATMNPLMEQDGLPKFGKIEPKHLTPAVEDLLAKLESDFSSMEADLSKKSDIDVIDYDEVLPVLEKMQYPIGFVWGIAGHLNGVKNGDELREAYESNQPKVVQSMTQFSQSKPLFDALSAIEKQWEESKDEDDCPSFLMKQQRRAVESSLLDMKLGGVGLEGDEKERFNEIRQRLAKLSNSFSNNVLDDTKAFSHTVENSEVMEGVPESARALWANSYAQHMKSEAKEGEEVPEIDMDKATESGPWRVTLDIPSYLPVMQHVKDRSLREKIYKAYIQRASEKNDDKNNVPLIYEILTLKQEMAKMLGFSNYAELSLAKKMAPSVEAVTELTDLMAKKAIPAARKELEEVTALARKEGGDDYAEGVLEKLEPWDTTFWVRKSPKHLVSCQFPPITKKKRNSNFPYLSPEYLNMNIIRVNV